MTNEMLPCLPVLRADCRGRHVPELDDEGHPYCMACMKRGRIVFDETWVSLDVTK